MPTAPSRKKAKAKQEMRSMPARRSSANPLFKEYFVKEQEDFAKNYPVAYFAVCAFLFFVIVFFIVSMTMQFLQYA